MDGLRKKEYKEVTYEELVEKLKTYITDEEELKTIDNAYKFAYQHHLGKRRKSGDDYISHPINVAYILTGLNADYITISSALLHEVINHGGATLKEVTDSFGNEISGMANSISKINKLALSDDKEASAINLRKVLVGLSSDVRVLFVKLADRLHNMRTIWALDPEVQKAKAN